MATRKLKDRIDWFKVSIALAALCGGLGWFASINGAELVRGWSAASQFTDMQQSLNRESRSLMRCQRELARRDDPLN